MLLYDLESKSVVKTINNPQGSLKYLSIIPLGIDKPRFLSRHVRYLLLKDEQSVSVLDTVTLVSWVISHADINRSQSSKGALPCLNSIAIEWINSNPPERKHDEPKIDRVRIYSTEDAWSIRVIEITA